MRKITRLGGLVIAAGVMIWAPVTNLHFPKAEPRKTPAVFKTAAMSAMGSPRLRRQRSVHQESA